jgi:hypothetical protein
MIDWLLRDRSTGQIVIVQPPNLPMRIHAASVVTRGLLPAGSDVRRAADVAAVLSLGWWAADELVRGVNPFRRIVGAATLVVLVTRRVDR